MEEKERSQGWHPEAWAEHLEKGTAPSRSCLRGQRRGSVRDVFSVRKVLVTWDALDPSLLLRLISGPELHFTQWTKGPHMLLLLHKMHFRPVYPLAASSSTRSSARQWTLSNCPSQLKAPSLTALRSLCTAPTSLFTKSSLCSLSPLRRQAPRGSQASSISGSSARCQSQEWGQ